MTVRGPAIKLVIFVLVTSVISFLLATVVGNMRFGPTNSYTAVFANASGIKKGDDVKVAGVPIGKIESVDLESATSVIVKFSVDTKRSLMSGTVAEIRYKNLLADRYMQLTEGPGGASPLEPGSEIPMTQTRGSLDIDELVNGFRPLLQGLDPEATNKLTASVIGVLSGQSTDIADLVQQVGSLSTTLANRDEVVGHVVENLGAVMATVDKRGDDLSKVLLDLQQLLSGLNTDRDKITTAVDQLDRASSTVSAVLSDARSPLTADIAELGTLAGNLNAKTDMLNLLLGKLPDAYQKISRVSSYGNFVNFFVCGIGIKYPGLTGGADTPIFTAPADRCN